MAADAQTGVPRTGAVAVVIPTLNEEDSIGAVVASLPRDVVSQVIVADGGSIDGTAERARQAGAFVVAAGTVNDASLYTVGAIARVKALPSIPYTDDRARSSSSRAGSDGPAPTALQYLSHS